MAWSFEVRHGRLDKLPVAFVDLVEEQRRLDADCFFVAEAGALLNEPEEQLVVSVQKRATPPQVVGRLGDAFTWLFDRLEVEIDQNFKWNYLKLSFITLSPLHTREGSVSGQMTTNAPELPAPAEQSPALAPYHIVKTLGSFFGHLRGSVESLHWDDPDTCDWVTMVFNKAS